MLECLKFLYHDFLPTFRTEVNLNAFKLFRTKKSNYCLPGKLFTLPFLHFFQYLKFSVFSFPPCLVPKCFISRQITPPGGQIRGACQELRHPFSQRSAASKSKYTVAITFKINSYERNVTMKVKCIDNHTWKNHINTAASKGHCRRLQVSFGKQVALAVVKYELD